MGRKKYKCTECGTEFDSLGAAAQLCPAPHMATLGSNHTLSASDWARLKDKGAYNEDNPMPDNPKDAERMRREQEEKRRR